MRASSRRRRRHHRLLLPALLAGLAAASCNCDAVPVGPVHGGGDPVAAPPRLEVLWSPAEGVLPFPDASFLDARAQGLLPADTALDPVRRALLAYTRAGVAADAPIAVELSAPARPDSLADAIAVLRDDGSRVDVDVVATLGGKGVLARPRAPLAAGVRYTVVVDGGALTGAGGEPAARSASFAYAMGDTDDASTLPGGRATADKLVPLRPLYDALAAVAERGGIARDDVACAFAFTVSDVPRLILDAEAQRAAGGAGGPWPSDFATDADGRTTLPPVQLEDTMLDADQLAVTAAAVAAVPGFSTSARVRVPLSAPIDDVAAGGFALYDLDAAGAALGTPVDDVGVTASPDATTVFLRRTPALLPGRSYALVVTDEARSGARPLAPSLDGALLTVDAALADAGRSVTAVLTDEHARLLEPERARLASLLTRVGRARVVSAVAFDTIDAFAYVDGLAQRAAAVAPALHDVQVASPFSRGLFVVMPDVDTVVSGTFTSLDAIDPVTLRAGPPRQSEVPFVLSLPPAPADGSPIPVVIFGHGLITAKELSYLIANQLAQAGFATFAIDLPLHGERSVCLVDAHCDLFQHCGEDHQCKDGGGNPGSLAAGDSPFDGGPTIPLATGEAFVLVDDLVASRDHFAQGMVDLRQSLRLLEAGAFDDVDGSGVVLERDRFGWLGISLGGIFGAMMSGSTTDITDFVLNVPGADLVVTLEDSTVLSPLLSAELSKRNVERGSAAFQDFEDVAHLVLDPVDPLNLAPRATSVDVPVDWQEKRVILQMADTDLVVPNSATRALAAATHLPISEYHPLISNHGFLLDPTSFEGADARDEAVQFLLGN